MSTEQPSTRAWPTCLPAVQRTRGHTVENPLSPPLYSVDQMDEHKNTLYCVLVYTYSYTRSMAMRMRYAVNVHMRK